MGFKKWFALGMAVFIMIAALNTKGFGIAQTNLQLTEEEKAFIASHPEVHLGVDPQFIPYEFFDTDGVYKGIAADYIDLLSQKTGLKFVIEEGLTWNEAYEKGVLKELDALPCVSKTKDRETHFLFTSPYYSFQRVVFINENNQNIVNFDDLKNRKVAVQQNSSHHGYLKAKPNMELSLYKTVEDAIQAVSVGTEEAFVGNLATTTYLMKSEGITNLEYIMIDSEEKQYLYFAVRNDWPVLVNILNKGLTSITKEEKIAIDNKWLGRANKADYSGLVKVLMLVGAAVILVFAVSIFWIAKLKKEIRMRKKIEEALKIAKEDAETAKGEAEGAREEAERANQFKSTFLARMSHEVRTPLNAITGMTYIIKKTDLTPTQKLYLEKISRGAKDMLGIINDILDFSKIEAGKIELEHISFNLDEVIEDVVNIVSFKIEEQKIDFSMHKDTDIPNYFWGDPKRMQQILLNIVNNAIKFTNEGAVSISLRFVAKVKDDYVIEISVKDTGIGMTPQQLEELFTPFTQADATITRRFGGTGLGLSIVKSLVEMMGGSIKVYSEVGEGSTFSITLTLESDRDKDYEERREKASLYFKNIRVLVVEKNFFYSTLIKEYLQSFNLVADFAQTGERAMEILESASKDNSKPYNLVIVDQETPQEGAIAFYNKFKTMESLKEIPKTIVLIPHSQEELLDKIEANGLDLGITKPVIPSILYNGIMEIFKFNVLEIHDRAALSKNPEQFTVSGHVHVMVVEDNKTNQFIAKSILEQAGYMVSLVDNGKEAVDLFSEKPHEFTLILMDLHMPIMDGYEATQLIRQADTEIPIIAMTADAVTGVDKKCEAIGISEYISKPFDPDQFLERLWQVTQEHPKNIAKGLDQPLGPIEDAQNAIGLDIEDGIKHIGGNREMYLMVLKEYFEENKNTTHRLNQAIEENRYEEAVQIVHKLKSSSGSIGAKALYETAILLQKALKEKGQGETLIGRSTEEIQALRLQFSKILEKVLEEIENLVEPFN